MKNPAPQWNRDLPPKQDCDLALIRRIQSGETAARAELVDRVLNQVRRTASYLAGGREDGEDLAQTALIRILQAAPDFRGEASLDYWAERITVHTCAKAFEKNNRRRTILAESVAPAPPPQSIDDQTEARRARYRLAEMLGTLEFSIRATMVLHYLEDRSIQETADLTDAPVNTVRGRLREGRKKLRKKILNDPVLKHWVKEPAS